MSRIAATFRRLKEQQRKAVVPYLVAGDPAPEHTVAIMHGLVAAGADIVELGVPFSDPMAEGPVIQQAHERALEHGVSLRQVLQMVSEFRRGDADTPVVLMGYTNPVEAMGYERFAENAAASQIDGLLTVDLPPEEGGQLRDLLAARGIDTIMLLAPTTAPERLSAVCDNASGYLYYVSLKGVTGAGHLDTESVRDKMALIRQRTELPVTVGFGIKDAVSAKVVAGYCDGVVIGSAIVDSIAGEAARGAASTQELIAPAVSLVESIRRAVDNV